MAEFGYNAIQTVAPENGCILNTIIGCNKGYVLHREQSSNITLRGCVNGNCRFARYKVTANCNIAITDGEGPIAVSLYLDGESIPTSRAIVTPAAVGDYFNVTSTAIIDVARGCCDTVSLDNNTSSVNTTPTSIDVQNLNVVIERVA